MTECSQIDIAEYLYDIICTHDLLLWFLGVANGKLKNKDDWQGIKSEYGYA